MGLICNKISGLFGIPSNVWSSYFFVAFWLMNVLVSGVKVRCIVYCFSVDRGLFYWSSLLYGIHTLVFGTLSILLGYLCGLHKIECGVMLSNHSICSWEEYLLVIDEMDPVLSALYLTCLYVIFVCFCVWYIFCVAPSVSDGLLSVSACYETGLSIGWWGRTGFVQLVIAGVGWWYRTFYSLLCIHH